METKIIEIKSKADLEAYFDSLSLGKAPTFCRICNRQLTDPKSIQAGIGPECARKGLAIGDEGEGE